MAPIQIVSGEAPFLAAKAKALAGTAHELASFVEAEPELASQAAIEASVLEARAILRRGSLIRIASTVSMRRPFVTQEDFEDMSRLETISSLAVSRLEGLGASMGEADRSINISRLSEVVGLAATALGIVKTIF